MFDLATLYAKFPVPQPPPHTEPCDAADLPPPYHELLVHQHHMTVTVERFYGTPVTVEVLESHRVGSRYLRKILLRLSTTQQVVQFGLVEVNLEVLPGPVASEILQGQTPLGRILIQHEVLRSVEPFAYFRSIWPQTWSATPTHNTYGRLGLILTGNELAVSVCEILTPISETISQNII